MTQTGENVILTIAEYNKLVSDNKWLHEQLALLKRLIFGAKSERFISGQPDASQLTLELSSATVQEETKAPEKEKITYQREKKDKNKPVRKELPAHLPRREEIIEPENIPDGAIKIGEAVTETLEYEPYNLFVRRIVRPKYVIKREEGVQIMVADLPSLPLPRSNASASLLSYIIISKYVDHLPFYRLAKIFKRNGVEIAENTINGWYSAACNLLELLYEEMKKQVQKSDYIQADETPIRVLTSEKPGSSHKGYYWVYHSPPKRLVVFDYQKGRDQSGPNDMLKDFIGKLQTDGYAAYTQFGLREGIKLLACMAHVRRKFEQSIDNYSDIAKYVMGEIQKLYALEREAVEKKLTADEILKMRQEKALPIMDNLEKYLLEKRNHVVPKSSIGMAISYALNLWKRLKVYLTDPKTLIDNNLIENTIRPAALGRKNYLFAGSHEAAQRAAMMYSFLGTCKLNNVEPFTWLKETLEKIPDCKIPNLKELFPGYKKPEC
jgi:transposase